MKKGALRSERFYIEVKTRRVNINIARNTAVPFRGQTTLMSCSSSPQRDRGPEGVDFYIEAKNRRVNIIIARNTALECGSNIFHLKIDLANDFSAGLGVPLIACSTAE